MSIILIDLDEVCAGLLEYTVALYNKDNGTLLDWKMLDDWHSNGDMLRPYFEKEQTFLRLPVIEESQAILKRISERHDVFFVTAAPTPHSAMEKKIWVEVNFPFIGHKRTIITHDKYLINGDLLFDDSPVFLPDFPKIKVCKNMPYNQHIEADYRVDNWIDFYTIIMLLERNGTLVPSPDLSDHIENLQKQVDAVEDLRGGD